MRGHASGTSEADIGALSLQRNCAVVGTEGQARGVELPVGVVNLRGSCRGRLRRQDLGMTMTGIMDAAPPSGQLGRSAASRKPLGQCYRGRGHVQRFQFVPPRPRGFPAVSATEQSCTASRCILVTRFGVVSLQPNCLRPGMLAGLRQSAGASKRSSSRRHKCRINPVHGL